MHCYFYLHLCFLKGIWLFVERLFQNRCELCIRNNINRLRINVRSFLIFNHFAVNFIQELHTHRVCIWIHMCVQVLQFVCMSTNKQRTSVRKAVHRNSFHLKMCLYKLLTSWKTWCFLKVSVFTLIHTQWIWCMVDLKMSLSCFNRYNNLFLVISSGRIAWIILNQRDSFYNNRLP